MSLVLSIAMLVVADEGQWQPAQIAELDLAARGLELSPAEVWGDEDSLLQAVVNYGGCSASFISKDGLIATNHHCAYGDIQTHSTVENNYLRDGFLAKTRAEELPAIGRGTVTVLLSVEDVTVEVLAAADAAKDDRARHLAIEKRRAELVKDCEASGEHRCQVASFFFGGRFELHRTFELLDVRIVYAPPAMVGEYGGDVDNWMWPRHTGDFTLLRAYVGQDGKPAEKSDDNVPYLPNRWLEIGHEGVAPGDFVAVMGYPGHTDRYLPAVEIERQVRQVLPGRVEFYREWIGLLEAAAEKDPAAAIKVAALKKGLANREKNARGMLAGIQRMGLLKRRSREDAQLALNPDHKRVLVGLAELTKDKEAVFQRDFLIYSLSRGPALLGVAIDLARRAREAKKADLDRQPLYMDRNTRVLWSYQVRRLKSFDAGVDAALMKAAMARQKIASLTGDPTSLVAGSKLSDEQVVKKLFDARSVEALKKAKDPLIDLALRLAEEIEAAEAEQERRAGAMSRLGPKLIEMLKSIRSGPVYPDANGTLRFSYAEVKGYSPRDGLIATPQTFLDGALEKHTGAHPFDLPEKVRKQADAGRDSYWADPQLGDVPICFLSNADTTGGNSGSPAVDRRGRLVGLNFDRVWENIAGDFGYNTARSRNVIADIRYLLFLLDRVEDAGPLLDELGVAAYRTQPRRAPAPEAQRSLPKDPPGASCSSVPGPSLWALLPLIWVFRRQRS